MLSNTYKYQGIGVSPFNDSIATITTYQPTNNRKLPPPQPFLPITILKDTQYTITFGNPGNQFVLMFSLTFVPLNTIHNIFFSTSSNSVSIVLSSGVPLQIGTYEMNDRYFIVFTSDQVTVYAGRKGSFDIHDNDIQNNILSNVVNNVNNNINNNINNYLRIPIINIYGQTLYNSENLSDMTFIIEDKYKYYDNTKRCKNTCKLRYSDKYKLKKTKFLLFDIPMLKVVKGKGKTLENKLLDTFYKYNPTISFQDFYEKMIRYSMLKYILCKILYGDFNIDYLYRKYNKQFFKDLDHSRFCGFIEFFEDPVNGIEYYDQYFLK
jgi:hypothetical protein